MRTLVVIVLLCGSLWAATVVATPSGTGTHSGADWSNACNGLTGNCALSALARGDTLYLAGNGHYTTSGGTFSTAVSGTTTITVKGATASDHGPATGWTSSLGVDVHQALLDGGNCSVFPGCVFAIFTTGYWVINGQVASSASTPSTYGFAISFPDCTHDIEGFHYGNGPGQTIQGIQIKYVALDASSCGSTSIGRTLVNMSAQGLHTGNTFSHFYCSGNANCISIRAGDNGNISQNDLVEYGYIVSAFSDVSHHGTAVSSWSTNNMLFRYNQIYSCTGTACLSAELPSTNALIYGNIFANNTGSNNGTIASTSGDYWQNTSVLNNVFATNAASGGNWWAGCVFGDGSCSSATGNVLEDNIIWNQNCALNGGDSPTHDYNSYLSCLDTAPTDAHGQVKSLNPFTNTAASNYTLISAPVSSCASSVAVCGGLNESGFYTVDLLGNTFGANGQWERGAYAFVAPQGACGVSGDTNVHIPASYDTFTPPALGGSYVDATFGCKVTRLTDGINNPGTQTCTNATCQGKHFYSLIAPDNADHSMVDVTLNGLPAIIAGPVTTYASPGTILVKQSNFPTSNLTSQGFVVWDIVDPLTFYYTATNKFNMGKITGLPGCAATNSCTIATTTLATFSSYTAVSLMDDEDISEDGLHYYLGAHSGSAINDAGCASPSQLCDLLYIGLDATGGNATTATLLGTPLTGAYWHKIQAALGNYYQLENLNNGGNAVEYKPDGSTYLTLLTTSHHDFIHRPSDNAELLFGAGWNTGAAGNICAHHNGSGSVTTSNGTMILCALEVFLPGNSSYGTPPATAPASHWSTRDLSGQWAIFEAESYGPGTCPNSANPYCEPGVAPATTTMTAWGLYDGEIDAFKTDGSQVLRLAHHRSRSGAGYWAGSRAAISRDARYVYFDSNFDSCPTSGGCGSQTTTNDPNYTDLYVISFSGGSSSPPQTAPTAVIFAELKKSDSTTIQPTVTQYKGEK